MCDDENESRSDDSETMPIRKSTVSKKKSSHSNGSNSNF